MFSLRTSTEFGKFTTTLATFLARECALDQTCVRVVNKKQVYEKATLQGERLEEFTTLRYRLSFKR